MREEILLNQHNALQLEKLYRGNKPGFKAAFNALYPELPGNPLAEGWYQRLNFGQDELSGGQVRGVRPASAHLWWRLRSSPH